MDSVEDLTLYPNATKDHDQDTTDLEKALKLIDDRVDGVIILGKYAGVEGRLDHTFAIANTLYSLQQESASDCICAEKAGLDGCRYLNKVFWMVRTTSFLVVFS